MISRADQSEREPRPAEREEPVVTPADRTRALTPATVLALQRSGAGNHAIANVLARRRSLARLHDGQLEADERERKQLTTLPDEEQPEPVPQITETATPVKAAKPKKRKKKKKTPAKVEPTKPTPVSTPGSYPGGLTKTQWSRLNPNQQEALRRRETNEKKSAEADARTKANDAAYERRAAPQRALLIPQLETCLAELQEHLPALDANRRAAGTAAPASLVVVLNAVHERIADLHDFLATRAKQADPEKELAPALLRAQGLIQGVEQELAGRRTLSPEQAEAAAWERLKTDILGFVPRRFAEVSWDGGRGPAFEFSVSQARKRAATTYCRTQFADKVIPGWETKKNRGAMRDIRDWTGKTVRYYVTASSESGAAFDISAHVWEGETDTFKTMVVLHVPLRS